MDGTPRKSSPFVPAIRIGTEGGLPLVQESYLRITALSPYSKTCLGTWWERICLCLQPYRPRYTNVHTDLQTHADTPGMSSWDQEVLVAMGHTFRLSFSKCLQHSHNFCGHMPAQWKPLPTQVAQSMHYASPGTTEIKEASQTFALIG
jgi:hypothetical protein